jgi:heme A synthase
VIRERPGAYAKLVAGDFLRFFRPGPHARYGEDATVTFPERARIRFDDPATRRRLFPGLSTHADAPAGLLRSYAAVFHTSRLLVAFVTLISLVALLVGLKRRDPLAPSIFLALAIALSLLAGAALTATFALRYLVPCVTEFAVAGTLSGVLLARAGAGRRAAAPGAPPATAQS